MIIKRKSWRNMNNEDRIKGLFLASPEQLAAIDKVLTGDLGPERINLRLMRPGEAAKESGLSRTLIWRLCKEGIIKVVELRRGSLRIPEEELRRLVKSAKPMNGEMNAATGLNCH